MNQATWEFLNPIGARLGKVNAIPVTTASVVIDLSTYTNIWAALIAGRAVLVKATADVYYAFNSENGGTIDQTASGTGSQATHCDVIPAGSCLPLKPPYVTQADVNGSAGAITNVGMCRYLLVKGDVATILRVQVVSERPSTRSAS
jgi:hypothetical protein